MKPFLNKYLFLLIFLIPFVGCNNDDDAGEASQLPDMTSLISNIQLEATLTSIVINGKVNNDNNVTSYGVAWGTNPNPTISDNVTYPEPSTSAQNKRTTKQSEDSFVVKITGLNPGNTYYFRTFATNDAGTAYGEEMTLQTTGMAESKWELTFHHSEDISWFAHVTFYEDGTAFYTEPESPGTYDEWGVWKFEDGLLIYDMLPEDDKEDYILTGEIEENTYNGTYTFVEENKPFTGVLISTEAD
jgi:hypothetical protein